MSTDSPTVNIVIDTPEEPIFRLRDRIREARRIEPLRHADGSTTLYMPIHKLEQYTTLPRPRWRWTGKRAMSSSISRRTTRVRRVRRRITDLS